MIVGVLFKVVEKYFARTRNEQTKGVGIDINSKRTELRLPKIDDGWILHWKTDSSQYWSNPSNSVNSELPIHLSKSVRFKDGKLISEQDIFHFEGRDSVAFKLRAIYFYDTNTCDFELTKYFRTGISLPISIKITRHAADSILSKWNQQGYYHTCQ